MGSEVIAYTIWVVECVLLGFILYRVLKRNLHNRINQLFGITLICGILSVIIGLAKVLMVSVFQISILPVINLFPLFFSCVGMAFLLDLIFILYKPEEMTNNRQVLVALVYGGLLAVIFFIPDGIQLKPAPGRVLLVTVFSFTLMIYMVILLSCSIFTILFMYKKIYKTFTDPELTKRFRCLILGGVLLHYSPFGICIVNYLNISIVRTYFSYTLLIVFIGILLVYYGIGTSFERE